ncbi:hypothetical protein [Novosphingobium sp.]|jgi:hypothetical protein|uniref:hypothetical protein n=1 Tax=Novosphingobium sp. TaxID=1874826 RepID=UPI0028A9D3ED|nr:hypothetical protein [Novosphingobium sp.]
MNGYVNFETLDGDVLAINADRVSFVRRYRGTDQASAINFEKGHYVVVKGNLETVMQELAHA